MSRLLCCKAQGYGNRNEIEKGTVAEKLKLEKSPPVFENKIRRVLILNKGGDAMV
jgi:hypothetical protein